MKIEKTIRVNLTVPASILIKTRKMALSTVALALLLGTTFSSPVIGGQTTASPSRSETITTETAATRSAAASIRTLTATAWCLISEAPLMKATEESEIKAVTRFTMKRDRVLTAIKVALRNKNIPSIRKLETINEWILKLHILAAKSDIFEKNSVDMVIFTGNMTVAQGYIDCAIFMAKGNKELCID